MKSELDAKAQLSAVVVALTIAVTMLLPPAAAHAGVGPTGSNAGNQLNKALVPITVVSAHRTGATSVHVIWTGITRLQEQFAIFKRWSDQQPPIDPFGWIGNPDFPIWTWKEFIVSDPSARQADAPFTESPNYGGHDWYMVCQGSKLHAIDYHVTTIVSGCSKPIIETFAPTDLAPITFIEPQPAHSNGHRIHVTIAGAPIVTPFRATRVVAPSDLRSKPVPGTPAYQASVAQTRKLGIDPGDPLILAKWRAHFADLKPPSAPTTQHHGLEKVAYTRRTSPAGMAQRILGRYSGRGYFSVMAGRLAPNAVAQQHIAGFKIESGPGGAGDPNAASTPGPVTPVAGSAATLPPNSFVTPRPVYNPGVAPMPKAPEIMRVINTDAWPHPVVTSIEIDGGTQTSFHEGDTILIHGTGLGGFSENFHMPYAPKIKVDFGGCGSFYLNVDKVGDDGTWIMADAGDPKVDGILPVDKRNKGGFLFLSTAGGQAAPVAITYNAWLGQANEKFGVWMSGQVYRPTGSIAYADDLGMISASDFFINYVGGPRHSCCPQWLGGVGDSGQDSFGHSDHLLNDWKYVSAHVTPAGSGTSGKDFYAGISSTPDNATLNTNIDWFYEPGHYIYYIVEMNAEGPIDVRAADSMAPTGLCGD
jgi:hypothetical protein